MVQLGLELPLLFSPFIYDPLCLANDKEQGYEYHTHNEDGKPEYEILELDKRLVLLSKILNYFKDTQDMSRVADKRAYPRERNIGPQFLLAPHLLYSKTPETSPSGDKP